MRNPFPGMNPYLEQADLWHQVHNRLIVAIANDLTPRLAPSYRVSIEERVYTYNGDTPFIGVADVAVFNPPDRAAVSPSGATATLPQRVRVPMPEVVTERYLEVRPVRSQEVVCVIEVLSPKKKRAGEGRMAYEAKRQAVLGSRSHLVEIDLLRSGEPILVFGGGSSAYRVMISRSDCRPEADLYALGLRDRLPVIAIPLRGGEMEPTVDLQARVNQVFEEARFDLAIDYGQALKPRLDGEEQGWVEQILAML